MQPTRNPCGNLAKNGIRANSIEPKALRFSRQVPFVALVNSTRFGASITAHTKRTSPHSLADDNRIGCVMRALLSAFPSGSLRIPSSTLDGNGGGGSSWLQFPSGSLAFFRRLVKEDAKPPIKLRVFPSGSLRILSPTLKEAKRGKDADFGFPSGSLRILSPTAELGTEHPRKGNPGFQADLSAFSHRLDGKYRLDPLERKFPSGSIRILSPT
jgi:hypothetical protein